MQKELVKNLLESFTSLSKSHEPNLVCVPLFSTLFFSHSISPKRWRHGFTKVLSVWLLSLLRGPFSMDLLEQAQLLSLFGVRVRRVPFLRY